MHGRILFFCLLCCQIVFGQKSGDSCTIRDTSEQGTCKILKSCPAALGSGRKRRIPSRCDVDGSDEVVCCPKPIQSITRTKREQPLQKSRISETKCAEYAKIVYEKKNETDFDTCTLNVVPLILGGIKAEKSEFPHMAILGFERDDKEVSWYCGGTLLSEEYVLTAAHCLSSRDSNTLKYVRLGDLDISTDTDGVQPDVFNIKETTVHPDFKQPSKYNDIGLIRLDRKVKFNKSIRPACLSTVFDGSEANAIVSGWGITEFYGDPLNHMIKIRVAVTSHAKCNETYSGSFGRSLKDGILEDSQFCAGPKGGLNDFCHVSSGEPLQVRHPDQHCMWSVIGISTFGFGCDRNGDVPSVYTKIYPYLDWIESIVWN